MEGRKLQAQKTKRKLQETGVDLLGEKDFDDISVREICEKAGVSVGTFYNYYDTKNDILKSIHERGDQYFTDVIKPTLNSQNSLSNIKKYFISYIEFVKQDGVEMLKHLYVPQNKFFIKANKPMHNILKNIIKQGQQKKQISEEMTPTEITNFILVISRGIIFDWCLHDGQYDIVNYSEDFIQFICDSIKRSL